MKTFTKVFACLLVISMLFSLAACGGGTQATKAPTAAPTVAPTVAPTADPDADADPDANTQDGDAISAAARDKVYELLKQYPISFNGLGPLHIDDRKDVNKGLPREKKDPADVTIGFSAGSMSSPYFVNLIEGTQREAKDAGFNIILQLNNGNTELAYQQMDAFISQGLDMIVAVTDPTTADPVFRRAVEAGIPCMATSAQAMGGGNAVITNILGAGLVAGFAVGDYTARYLYDKFPKDHVFNMGTVIFTLGNGETQSRNTGFYSGFLYALAELDGNPYPSKWPAIVDGFGCWLKLSEEGIYDASQDGFRINLRGYGSGNTADAPGGQLGCSDLIVAHPEIEVLTFDACTMFPGAEPVLKQNGKTPGEDIYIACAADGSPYAMECIKEGRIIAVGNNSSSMNAYGLISAARAIFIEGRDMNNIVPNTYTPTTAITAENLDQFYDPDLPMAKGIPYELEDIDDYNLRMSDAGGDPF